MVHMRVAKSDLRTQVVNARTATAESISASPVLEASLRAGARTVAIPSGIDAITDPGVDQIAGLASPVGDGALRGMYLEPSGPATVPLSSEAQYAAADQVDMDEIDINDLGDGELANLQSPVDTGQLQETRAGFVLNNGIRIDFAVTRLTSVDGLDQLQTITNMPQGIDAETLGQISAGKAGNSRVLAPGGGSVFSVIQNDLDNQRILDVTTIDVGIKNFGLRSINYVRPALNGGSIPAELRR
jgi:hypothetical protein